MNHRCRPSSFPYFLTRLQRTQEGESRRLEVETRGRSSAGMGCKTQQRSRFYAGQPIGGRIAVRRTGESSAHERVTVVQRCRA
jgi:hypothetical protein